MAYETQCGGCTYYDFQGDNVKGYCSWYRCYYYPGDSCSHQNPREQDTSTCYITTIVCNKLNLSDDCEILNTLRYFRNNVMQRDYNYCGLLFEYDVIGPKIAKMIKDDKDTEYETWQMLYNCYLLQTANLVEEGKYDEAIFMYKRMINVLKSHYGINESIDEIIMNYDFAQGGHGRVKLIERTRKNYN